MRFAGIHSPWQLPRSFNTPASMGIGWPIVIPLLIPVKTGAIKQIVTRDAVPRARAVELL